MLFNRSHNSRALHATRRRIGLMVVVALLAPLAISIAAAPPAAALPATTTVLTSSANPINVIDGTAIGDSTYLTATVTSANGVTVNNGVVDFYVNGSPTTTVPVSGGVATTPSRNWSTGGIKSIRAEFNGSPTFAASTSNMIEELVTWKPTATTVALANGPLLTTTQPTFNVSVTSSAGTPAGKVQLYDAGTALGAQTTLSGGSASVTVPSTLSVGSHGISAVFTSASGSGWDTSVGTTSAVVGQPTTTLTITPNATTRKYGQSTSFDITVAASTPPSTYLGTVKLYGNGTYLTEGSVDSTGHVTLATTSLPVGPVTVAAVYIGPQIGNAYATTTVTVSTWSYTMAMSTGPATVFATDQVTLTASVQAEAGAPAMNGTGMGVTFTDNGTSVGFALLTGSAPNYTATLQVPANLGQRDFGAVISNQPAAFASTTASTVRAFSKRLATTVVSVGAISGGNQTVQATVQEVASGAPSGVTPTGSVRFFIDGGKIADATLTSGVATWTYQPTTGYHEYAAVYLGDSKFAGLGTTAAALVGSDSRASTSVAVATSGTGYIGDPIVVSVDVTPAAAVAGDTVFVIETWLGFVGSATLDSAGHASVSMPFPPGGFDTVYAAFRGNATQRPASGIAGANVNLRFPSVSVTNPGAYNAGSPVTLRAAVTPAAGDSVMPTGSVAFLVDGLKVGTDVVGANGQASLTTSMPLGTHSITAQYLGDKRNVANLATVSATSASALAPVMSFDDNVRGNTHQFISHVDAPSSGLPAPTGNVVLWYEGGTSETATILNGVATFGRVTMTTGRHVVRAEYAGDTAYKAAESFTLATTTESTPTVTIAASANPAPTSTPVTFTVTVAPTAPGGTIPQGSVEIRSSEGLLTTRQLDANGQTQFSVAGCTGSCVPSAYPPIPDFVDFKTEPYRAEFLGDGANGYGHSAGSINQRPGLATSTNLYASPNPSNVQGAVTLASAVLPSTTFGDAPNPTGTVTFYDGTTPLGTAAVGSNGVASLTTTQLPQGTRSLTARYNGSTVMAQSQNVGAWSQTVNGLPVTGGVTASPTGPVSVGTTVTYTATINRSGSNPVPTGKVTFGDDFYGLIEALLVPSATSSTASISLQRTQLGNHTVTVNYQGDNLYAATHDGDLTSYVQSVLLPSTVSLSSSNPNSVATQSVTFTAGVGTEAGPATGTMQFMDGPNPLGSPVNLNGSGAATLTTSALTPGTHSITAVYSGSSTRAANTSPAVTQTVSALPVNLSLTSSVNPALRNQSINFTATATSGAGTPSGTVSFLDGTTVIGTGTLNGGGVATFSIGTLAAGTHSITATYAAQGDYGAKTSTAVSQVVNAATPSINLTSTDNPVQAGNYVTFSASVAQISGQPMPGGTFSFIDGATTLATVPGTALGSTLVASFATNSLTVGSHAIKVYYSGDSTYAGMNSTVLNQLVKNFSSTSLSSSVNPSADGQSVTFSATVSAPVGGNSIVRFYDGETLLGQGAVTAANMTATFTTSSLSVGSHFITAYYDGDANNMPSFAEALTQKVLYGVAMSAVGSSKSPSALGEAVTFDVSILAFGPTLTGTVTFKDGSSSLGTVPVDTNGYAEFTTSSLAIGTHSIYVTYNGDDSTAGETSGPTSQVVTKVPVNGVVTSSTNPSLVGSSVTFTATFTNGVATKTGKPSGSVTFKDGTATLGTATLNSSGVATYATSALIAGAHSITAVYGGDSTHATSTSPVLSQGVQTASHTSLITSKNPAVQDAAVTLKATVTGNGVPTGNVTFKDGAATIATVPLDSAGKAVLVVGFSSAGNHPITAVYGGDSTNAASTSSTLTQTVILPVGTPTGVSASVVGTVATVTFTGDPAATSFQARCTSTNGGTTTYGTATSSPVTVTKLSLTKTYYCQVQAINASGKSVYSANSNTFTIQNIPAVPTGVSVSVTGTVATVTFTGDPIATGYQARCTSTTGGALKYGNATSSPITVTGLTKTHTYYCQVQGSNASGTSAYSPNSTTFVIQDVPAVPTGVSTTRAGNTATVTFTGDPTATAYQARCTSTDGGTTRYGNRNASPITVSSLTAGKTYYCQVQGSNPSGTSAYSTNSNTI